MFSSIAYGIPLIRPLTYVTQISRHIPEDFVVRSRKVHPLLTQVFLSGYNASIGFDKWKRRSVVELERSSLLERGGPRSALALADRQASKRLRLTS
jgi:hypothetical protein